MTPISRSNDPPQAARVVATAAAYGGAFLLIGTSAALGSYYAFTVGSAQHVILGGILAAGTLGGELLKPFAFAGALQALAAWQPLRAAACLIVGAACVVYSLASGLALSAASRGDHAAQRGQQAEASAHAKERLEQAKAELATLPMTKPRGQLEAEIAGLLATPGADGCREINGKVTRAVCPQVTALRSELAQAAQRERLQGVMAEAGAKRERDAAVSAADPMADAVVLYSAAAGITLNAAAVGTWLHLIVVLFLEVGSALGIVVARSIAGERALATRSVVEENGDERTTAQSRATEAAAATGGTLEHGARLAVGSTVSKRAPRRGQALGKPVGTKDEAAARIVDALQDAGGKLPKAERGLAALIGGRKSTVHSAVAGLITAGVVARMGGELVLARA